MNLTKSPTYDRIYTPGLETKLYIYIDSSPPILTKVPALPGTLTLGRFKTATSLLNPKYKFYFRSNDSEFGEVKEELVDDDSIIPVEGDRVVAWVISNNIAQSKLFEPTQSVYNNGNQALRTEDAQSISKFPPNGHASGRRMITQSPIASHSGARYNHDRYISINLMQEEFIPLGLTILQPSASDGVHIAYVQPNSIASRDGRIKSGDKITELNGINLTGLRPDEANCIFKQIVEKSSAINLVLQKAAQPNESLLQPSSSPMPKFESNHRSETNTGFNPATDLPLPIIERREHVKAPAAPNRKTCSLPRSSTPRSLYTSNFDNLNSDNDLRLQMDSRSVYESSRPSSMRHIDVPLHCGKDNIYVIYEALKSDSESLDIKNRQWLKVMVENVFLGSSLIKWLSRNIYGFCNRSEVKRYANQMLNLGLIRSPMSNAAFSEKCYYTLS